MTPRTRLALTAFGLLGLGACQTAPQADAGFLQSYAGMAAPGKSLRASVRQSRDDPKADTIERVFIEPSILTAGAGERVSEEDRARVSREVDRQICYEVSRRFTVLAKFEEGAGRIRSAVVRIDPTGQAGSVLSVAASYFVPGPIGLRTPGTTGGLAAEAELIGPDGAQIAAVVWARNATLVGTDSPSLSPVGDALQMAAPFGDAVGAAFAPNGRRARPVAKPDPCEQFGPRFSAAGLVTSLATGLYVPEASGARPARGPEPSAETPKQAAGQAPLARP